MNALQERGVGSYPNKSSKLNVKMGFLSTPTKNDTDKPFLIGSDANA